MKRIIYFLFLVGLSTTHVFGQKKSKSLNDRIKLKGKSNFTINDSIAEDNSGTKKIKLSAKTFYTDRKWTYNIVSK